VSSLRRHPRLLTGASLLLLAAYVVAAFGVLPSPRVVLGWFGRVSGERYPCESCGCGCSSATECWTNCCCHTEHERLVWAITNGVMPPASVRFSDEQWIAASNDVKPGSAHCSLCVEGLKDNLRQGIAMRPLHDPACGKACDGRCGKGCCTTAAAGKPAAGSSCCTKAGGSATPSHGGPSISALTCKGLEQLLTITAPPAPPATLAIVTLPEPIPFVPSRPDDEFVASRTLDVHTPPPRTAIHLG
jgi:hypothetical protein